MFSIGSYGQSAIRFGVVYFYPPFVFSHKSGYIHGFDIDLAQAICQKLNAQCSFTPMSLEDLFVSLNQNKVDAIMGAISITPDRETGFSFTQPYYKSTMSFLTLNELNIDPNNLQNLRIGVEKASVFLQYLKQKYGNSPLRIITYKTNEEMVTALSQRQVDVILIDTPAADYWVKYSAGLFKLVGSPQALSFDKGYGIAVRKDNQGLLNSLNSALSAVSQDGTLAKIKQTYFKGL